MLGSQSYVDKLKALRETSSASFQNKDFEKSKRQCFIATGRTYLLQSYADPGVLGLFPGRAANVFVLEVASVK